MIEIQTQNAEPPFDVMRSLKAGTLDIHRRIEQRVPVFDACFDLAGYVRLLGGFYGFWAPVEIKLSQLKELRKAELDIESRLKCHLLEADLRFFGCDPATVPRCQKLPRIETFQSALGCMYVLEGSTLGGRFISARIESHLNVGPSSGGTYFNAYGEQTGERWSEFKRFVTANSSAADVVEIVGSAQQTFECFFEWLGQSG